MQVRTPRIKTSFSIAILWCIALFTSCSEDMPIDHPNGDLSGERISFGVSKGASSWKPDSRALQQTDFLTLPCISDDETFGVSLVVKEKAVPLSRGTQFTSADTLKAFDVAAYYYEESNSYTELFFNEKVNDGVHTSGKTYYWPREGKMDFMAFAPQDALSLPTVETYNGSTINIPYTITTEEQNHKDIIVATSIGLNNKESGLPVSLNFKHLLASVRFKVGEMQFIKINSLTLSGVYGGDVTFIYNKNTNTWTNSVPTTIKTYNPDFVDTSGLPQGSEIAGNVNNATLFMIPQKLPADAEIRVSYTELLTGNTGTGIANIGETTWEAGKDYAYAFNIGTKFDVTIPTPDDQDAHYIMLEMPYEVGALSDYITSIKATARFLDDGSNTSTKSGISLKFKSDLTETQKWGFWTDKQYQETITVDSDGGSTSSGVQEVGNIRGDAELSIGDNYSDIIVLFIEENNGTTYRNGELILTATLKNGTDVVVGQGNFKQLCPNWNNTGIGVERIETSNAMYPYGFDYTRKVNYTNPGNNWSWLKSIGRLLYSWGANGAITDDEGGFITIERKNDYILWIQFSYIDKITLNYGALNKVKEVANSSDGSVNTRALYNFTGGNDLAQIETDLNNNLGWVINQDDDSAIPQDYAAFIALARNRMYELKTITKSSGQDDVVSHKVLLYKDSNGEDIIEWYLPSSTEAQGLVETGVGSNVITPLNGTYWSSTAGSDTDAHAHSFTFNNNTFGSIKSQPRMDELKVRAVRKKP